MTTETKMRRIDVMDVMDRLYDEDYDDYDDPHEVAHELTFAIALDVETDARSRIDYHSPSAYPDFREAIDVALRWLREECAANGHLLCGIRRQGLLVVMSRILADALANGLKHKQSMAEYYTWEYSKLYDDSPPTPLDASGPIKDDYRIRLAAPEVEIARENLVNRLVDHHGYDRNVVVGWFTDASALAAAELSDDLPPVSEVGTNDWWNVALEWLSRTFALVWQREVRTLAREP